MSELPLCKQLRTDFANTGWSLEFVWSTASLLKRVGIYEECLLEAYQGVKTNLHRVSERALDTLFWLADKERLRQCGQPLPTPLPAVLYRGVSGAGVRMVMDQFSGVRLLVCAEILPASPGCL